jgi:hypothetical protein
MVLQGYQRALHKSQGALGLHPGYLGVVYYLPDLQDTEVALEGL